LIFIDRTTPKYILLRNTYTIIKYIMSFERVDNLKKIITMKIVKNMIFSIKEVLYLTTKNYVTEIFSKIPTNFLK